MLKAALRREVKDTNKSIDEVQSGIRHLEEGVRKHTETLERRKEIEKSIEGIRSQLTVITDARQQLASRREQREKNFDELLKAVREQRSAYDNVIEVYIGYLRRKTEAGDRPRLIHTVRGVGYVIRKE